MMRFVIGTLYNANPLTWNEFYICKYIYGSEQNYFKIWHTELATPLEVIWPFKGLNDRHI